MRGEQPVILTGFPPPQKKKRLEPLHEKCPPPVSQSKSSVRVQRTRGACLMLYMYNDFFFFAQWSQTQVVIFFGSMVSNNGGYFVLHGLLRP